MSSLSSSKGSLHLSSFPFPTLPIEISNSSSSDQYSTSSSTSDASFSSPSTPPSTPPSSNWNPLYPAPSGGIGRRRIMRRNSSLSSVNSSIYSEEEVDEDWTEEDEDKLKRTFETYLAHTAATEAPFIGLPPSNLTHVIARAVSSGESRIRTRSSTRARRGSSSAEGSNLEEDVVAPKWRHGMKSTRAKILALVKERQENSTEETPRQGDSDATPKRRKPPMVRQGSMDFLPAARNNAIVARLGSKLHRAEMSGPPASSHPYAHPTRGRLNRANSLCSLPSIIGSPSQIIPSHTSSTISQLSTSTSSSTRMARTNSDYSGNRDSTAFDSELSQLPKNWDQSLLPASTSSQNSLYQLSFDPSPQKLVVEGLGSAFSTPLLGVGSKYPSPISNRRNETSSTSLTPSSSGELSGEELNPLKRSARFEDGFLAREEAEGSRKAGGKGKFYINDNEYSSTGSLSSFGSNNSLASSSSTSTISRLVSTSSIPFPSTSSITYTTPSPRSSRAAFDLNDLSLGGSIDEESAQVLDSAYLKAGIEAKLLREQFKSWDWQGDRP